MACRLATCPTSRSPDLVKPTTEGVVRPPSSLAITFGSPPSITATTEFVVPRSIPIIFPMAFSLPAYKCFKISALPHNNEMIMRYECLTVKGLDVVYRDEVARKTGLHPSTKALLFEGITGEPELRIRYQLSK